MELTSLALLIVIALTVVVLSLRQRTLKLPDLGGVLREELRAGRGEAAAARELREGIERSQPESTTMLADTLGM